MATLDIDSRATHALIYAQRPRASVIANAVHMPSSLALPYSELRCPSCGVVQRNKLRSAGNRTLCLICGTASSTASWHPIGEPHIENAPYPYSQIRWVTVHLADRSLCARQFALDVSKHLLALVRRSSTRGIVATTSRFTRDAKEFLDTYRWQIEGKDRDDLLDWTKKYMARKPTRAWLK